MRHKERLIAYRTLLPDCFFDHNGNPHRFAWLSGNYVDPEYRRQGISTRLLQLAEAHWEGRLMYTNYAPVSKAVYDRSGQFRVLVQRPGKRLYLRAASGDLLGKRVGSRKVLATGDQLINRLRERMLQKYQPVQPSQCRVERIESFDRQVTELINQSKEQSLFRRDSGIFSWILDNPWVTESEVEPLDYQFSYKADRYENLLWKFTLPGDKGLGLLWVVIHNRKMSAPYLFLNKEEIYPLMARTLIHTMIKHGCAYSTIRNTRLAESLKQHRRQFLSIRNMPQIYFSHKTIVDQVPMNMEIQDGDGDVVFTG
jgi:GNAT superfamily N-acetyltransferase